MIFHFPERDFHHPTSAPGHHFDLFPKVSPPSHQGQKKSDENKSFLESRGKVFPGTAPGIMFHPIPIIVFNLINEFFLDVAISEELGEHKGIKKGGSILALFGAFWVQRSPSSIMELLCVKELLVRVYFLSFFAQRRHNAPSTLHSIQNNRKLGASRRVTKKLLIRLALICVFVQSATSQLLEHRTSAKNRTGF